MTIVTPAATRLDRLAVDWIDTCECPSHLHVRVALCAEGGAEALAAVHEFLRGSWLCDADLEYSRQILGLMDGDGANLREEGQVLRRGDRLLLWSGMRYLEREDAEADIDFAEFCALLRPFMQVIALQDRLRIGGTRLARVRYASAGTIEPLRFDRDTPPGDIPRAADLRVRSAHIPLRRGFSLRCIELQGAHSALALAILDEAGGYDWQAFSDALLAAHRSPWQSSRACIVREGEWLLLGTGRDRAIALQVDTARNLIRELQRIEALARACGRCEGVLRIEPGHKARIGRLQTESFA